MKNRMYNNHLTFNVTLENVGLRLDKYIFTRIEESDVQASRTVIQNLIGTDMVTVNGVKKSKSYKVGLADFVSILLPKPTELTIEAKDIPIDIVYEDKDILVVNKQKGMVVHPANGHWDDTLVNAILYHCGEELTGIGGVLRPGIVHRIDKDTSGLLVVAKNEIAYASLSKQLYDHSMKRQYHAICHGVIKQEEATIDFPIARDSANRKRFAVNEEGKVAVTNYYLIQNFKDYSYISLRLHTGRTHQIRVHMSYIGHPLAGDVLYGPKSTPTELMGQCLHAKSLVFVHPSTKKLVEFETDLPIYFNDFLKTIGNGVYT